MKYDIIIKNNNIYLRFHCGTMFEPQTLKNGNVVINGKNVKLGNRNFAGSKEIKESNIGTNIYLNIDGEVVGSITLSDEIKKDAKETIKHLTFYLVFFFFSSWCCRGNIV